MKKFILLAAVALGAMTTAQAQTTVEGSKFSDNWSLTLKGGAVTPAHHYEFFPNARGIFGVELRKQVTPVLGLGVEGEWTVNTSSWTGVRSKSTFDHQYVGAFTAVNLMNLFAGYKGAPRCFELEAVAGAGWLHAYYPHESSSERDANTWGTKAGLNINFNLGEAKAWTFSLRPAVLWNMGAGGKYDYMGHDARYDINHAYVEMQAALTYHFGNSNGTHSFVIVRPFDQAAYDALNSQINALRGELAATNAKSETLVERVATLQTQLDECVNRPAVVKEVVKNLNNVHYVFFNNASSVILANQQPQVALVAEALKADANAKVSVKGYASPVGSLAFNERLSKKRAEVVKNELVKKYGIDASRISTEGLGVGDIFNQSSWNRVAVMTVE